MHQGYGNYGGRPHAGQSTVTKYIDVTLPPTNLKNVPPHLKRSVPPTASTVLRSELLNLNGSFSKLMAKQLKSDATLWMKNHLQYGTDKNGDTIKGWVSLTVPMMDIPKWVEFAFYGCGKTFSNNPLEINLLSEVVKFVTTHYRLEPAVKTTDGVKPAIAVVWKRHVKDFRNGKTNGPKVWYDLRLNPAHRQTKESYNTPIRRGVQMASQVMSRDIKKWKALKLVRSTETIAGQILRWKPENDEHEATMPTGPVPNLVVSVVQPAAFAPPTAPTAPTGVAFGMGAPGLVGLAAAPLLPAYAPPPFAPTVPAPPIQAPAMNDATKIYFQNMLMHQQRLHEQKMQLMQQQHQQEQQQIAPEVQDMNADHLVTIAHQIVIKLKRKITKARLLLSLGTNYTEEDSFTAEKVSALSDTDDQPSRDVLAAVNARCRSAIEIKKTQASFDVLVEKIPSALYDLYSEVFSSEGEISITNNAQWNKWQLVGDDSTATAALEKIKAVTKDIKTEIASTCDAHKTFMQRHDVPSKLQRDHKIDMNKNWRPDDLLLKIFEIEDIITKEKKQLHVELVELNAPLPVDQRADVPSSTLSTFKSIETLKKQVKKLRSVYLSQIKNRLKKNASFKNSKKTLPKGSTALEEAIELENTYLSASNDTLMVAPQQEDPPVPPPTNNSNAMELDEVPMEVNVEEGEAGEEGGADEEQDMYDEEEHSDEEWNELIESGVKIINSILPDKLKWTLEDAVSSLQVLLNDVPSFLY